MRIKELTESTVAGAIATVESPLGGVQSRTKVKGLEPADKVMFGKTKKKGPYQNSLSEGKMKALAMDLRKDKDGLSDIEFKKKYNKTKEQMRKELQTKDKKVNEAELAEDDIIVVPGQGRKFRTGFVPKGQSRVDHEVEMARSDLFQAAKNAQKVYQLIKDISEEDGLDGWVQEKIIKANDYLNTVREYLEHKTYMSEMTGGVIAAGGVGESIDEAKLDEKFKSKQQAKLMYAVAGDKDVSKKTGVSQKVAKEFIKKSHGQKVKDLPKKVSKK